MDWKYRALLLCIIFSLAGCAGLGPTPTPTAESLPTVTRFPPSETVTPVILKTATTIPSYTPTSAASAVHYMLILDASASMAGDFGGRDQWEAALESAQTILAGLEPNANYGLTVLGASLTTPGVDLCNEPSAALVPFSAPAVVNGQLAHLTPQGGGSLTAAFFSAYRQFEGLPADTVKALIIITESEDACPGQDEWRGLENLLQAAREAGSVFHTEIIVLAPASDPDLDFAATRIMRASSLVGMQLPADNAELEEATLAAQARLQEYVAAALAGRPTATAESLAFTFTPDSGLPTNTLAASSFTLTPRPGTATFTPTVTLTLVPRTPTQTLTATLTRTPTPTRPPFVELLTASFRTTGIGCQVDITVKVSGSAATGSFHVMNSGNDPTGEVGPEVILPLGTYGNNIVTLTGNQPALYTHEVWFEVNGVESNRLRGLVCPLIPRTPTP